MASRSRSPPPRFYRPEIQSRNGHIWVKLDQSEGPQSCTFCTAPQSSVAPTLRGVYRCMLCGDYRCHQVHPHPPCLRRLLWDEAIAQEGLTPDQLEDRLADQGYGSARMRRRAHRMEQSPSQISQETGEDARAEVEEALQNMVTSQQLGQRPSAGVTAADPTPALTEVKEEPEE